MTSGDEAAGIDEAGSDEAAEAPVAGGGVRESMGERVASAAADAERRSSNRLIMQTCKPGKEANYSTSGSPSDHCSLSPSPHLEGPTRAASRSDGWG